MKRPDSTGKMSVITNSVIGVTKKEVYFDELQNVHKVEYDSCRYSGEESIERAKRRFKLKEKSYHALYNNSHFFVTWCKTGREYPLTDILVEISQGKCRSIIMCRCMYIYIYIFGGGVLMLSIFTLSSITVKCTLTQVGRAACSCMCVEGCMG